MKIETFNTLNLIPIGDVRFCFDKKSRKRKGTIIWVGAVNIMCETDRNITDETEKALMKLMKKASTDLLTDGRDFFTTRGNKITQVRHPKFDEILKDAQENGVDINNLLYK